MNITVAEILKPYRDSSGIMQDYKFLLADAHYARRKEHPGFFGYLTNYGAVKRKNREIRTQCSTLAFQQIDGLLKQSGLELLTLEGHDELALPEKDQDAAYTVLDGFVSGMNRLLKDNGVRANFSVDWCIPSGKKEF